MSEEARAAIPVVDFQRWARGGAGERREVARAIDDACRRVGFFYLSGHGIEPALIREAERRSFDFFALPQAAKLDVHIAKSSHHRGYFPIGEERALGASQIDLKEGFDMALELPLDDADVIAGLPFHGPNVWPERPRGFRVTMLNFYEALRGVAGSVCQAFALGLGLPLEFFADKIDKPLAQLRLLHYPSMSAHVPGAPVSCGAHSDYGIVSLLVQDEVGGLQVQTPGGAWIDAVPIPGTLVCNIGDMMERWTNGEWRATPHRVINVSRRDRYSMVMFFDPNYHCRVECLPTCQSPTNPPRYAPITMGEHLARGFDGTFNYRTKA